MSRGELQPLLELVLERLSTAGIDMREHGEDRYRGGCPACGKSDRLVLEPQLDGRGIYLKCWSATCAVEQIMSTLGLTWSDLRLDDDIEDQARNPELRNPDPSRARPVAWAWQARVPIGKVSINVGNEGVGKGTLTAYLAARLSRGELAGDLHGEPCNLLVVGDEDTLEDTWTPRLEAAGAAFEHVFFQHEGDFDLDFTNLGDVEHLRGWIRTYGIKVVVFDALLDHVGAGTDEFKPKAVRHALKPVRRLAKEEDIAAVGSMHPRKGRALTFRDLIANSHQFNAVSRSSLLIAEHPDDETRRVLVRGKGNHQAAPPALEFRIEGHVFELNGRRFNEARAVDWRETDLELDDLLRAAAGGPGRPKDAGAREAVEAVLTSEPQSERQIAKAAAVPRSTVQRILKELAEEGLARKLEDGWIGVAQNLGALNNGPPQEGGGFGGLEPNQVDQNPSEVSGNGPPPETVFLDTETTGLDPRAHELVAVGFAGDVGDPMVLRHPADRKEIQTWLELEATFVAHNIGFDMHFLQAAGYRLPDPACWQDTVLVAHVAGERRPGQTRLRRLTTELIKAGELEENTLEPEDQIKGWLRTARRTARKEGHRRPELGHAPGYLLEPYLAADIEATRAVWAHYGAAVGGQGPVLELERRCLPAIWAAERRGVPVDLDSARELRDSTEVNVDDLRARLFELAGGPFNPNAARQIEEALLNRGADLSGVPRTEKAGLPMFTADTLAAVDDELARVLLGYRAEKKLSDYIKGLWRHAHGDRLYGSFHQVGTETGRMSSGRPNLQNIPKSDLRVRHTICAGEGKLLVGADLDSVELRVLAAYAAGGALERAFAEGLDLHQQTADACGVSRDEGKRLNYLTIYGGGARLVADILGCELERAKAVLNRWYDTYPEVAHLKRRLADRVAERGYLETVGGRRHHFDQPNHMLLNRLVSGGCADLFKRSVIALHELDVPLVLLVHDEIVAEVSEDQSEKTACLLETELARDARAPGVEITGLVAGATVAKRWSDFKEPGYVPARPAKPSTSPGAPPIHIEGQLELGEAR